MLELQRTAGRWRGADLNEAIHAAGFHSPFGRELIQWHLKLFWSSIE